MMYHHVWHRTARQQINCGHVCDVWVRCKYAGRQTFSPVAGGRVVDDDNLWYVYAVDNLLVLPGQGR